MGEGNASAVIYEIIAERDAEIAALRAQVAELESALSKRDAQLAAMWRVVREHMMDLDKLRD